MKALRRNICIIDIYQSILSNKLLITSQIDEDNKTCVLPTKPYRCTQKANTKVLVRANNRNSLCTMVKI